MLHSNHIIPWVNDMFALPDNPAYIQNTFFAYNKFSFFERLENTLSVWHYKLIYEFWMKRSGNECSKKYLNEEVYGENDMEKEFSLMLVNTHYTFNRPRPLLPNVIEVGGIHIRKPEKLPEVRSDCK